MASAKDRLRNQADKSAVSTETRVPVDTGDEPRATTSRYPVNFPHRMTLDLSEEQHQGLRRKSFDAEIPKAHIVRALIDLYLDDPALAARAEGAAGQ